MLEIEFPPNEEQLERLAKALYTSVFQLNSEKDLTFDPWNRASWAQRTFCKAQVYAVLNELRRMSDEGACSI